MNLLGPLILVAALFIFLKISALSQTSNENEIDADYVPNYDYEFEGASQVSGLLSFNSYYLFK